MAPHSSTLAWKIPWMEEPGGLQSTGSRRVRHGWVTSLSLFAFMHWRRKWQPTPVFLPGESQNRGAWRAAVCGVAQSRTRLKWLSSHFYIWVLCQDKKEPDPRNESWWSWWSPRLSYISSQNFSWNIQFYEDKISFLSWDFYCLKIHAFNSIYIHLLWVISSPLTIKGKILLRCHVIFLKSVI